jgi:hypothetical protein
LLRPTAKVHGNGGIAQMKKFTQCERCIRGQVLSLGEEPACINCGWRPSAPTPGLIQQIKRDPAGARAA